jgi:DNA-binding PadR family transcriptional regulator
MVLSILNHGESYGYAIIQEIRRLSESEIEWTDGMLYPVLRRLEGQGLVKSEWRTAEAGKRRRYYWIEEPGKTALREHRRQWLVANHVLSQLWEQAPCLI